MRYLIALLLCCSTLMAVPPIGYNDPTIGGLVGWWTMNEGTGTVTTADLSGNGNTGYLTNSPAWTNGVVRSGLAFNGTNQWIKLGSSVCDFVGFQPFTISAYCYLKTTNGEQAIVSKYNYDGSSGQYLFWITSGKLNGYVFRTSYANRINQISSVFLSPSSWNHVAMVYSGGTSNESISLYKNGIQISYGTSDSGGILSPGMVSSGVELRIANMPNSSSSTDYLNGYLDDVRIYNRALSSDEILKLYNGGYGSQK